MKIIVIVDQNGTQKEQPVYHICEGYHRNNFMSLSLKLKDFDSMNILYTGFYHNLKASSSQSL